MISKHTPHRSGVKCSQLHLITAWVLGRLHCWIGPGIFNSPQCSRFFGTTFWFIPNALLHGQEKHWNSFPENHCRNLKYNWKGDLYDCQAASMTHCTKSHTEHILNLLAIQKLKSFCLVLGKWGCWNGWDNIGDGGCILIRVDEWKVYPQNSKYRASEGTIGGGGALQKIGLLTRIV